MKNKLMRAATLLMVLTLMTSCFVGSTFAKYTSTVSASDTATVAKWSIKVNGGEMTTNVPAFTFDLFNTIQDDALGGADDENVKDNLLAPGTGGSFALKVDNESEVTAKYTITLEEMSNLYSVPLQYSLDGTTWYDNFATIHNDASMKDKVLTMVAPNNTYTVTVHWRWAFDEDVANHHGSQSDLKDTDIGIAAQGALAPSVTIKATITATQVD